MALTGRLVVIRLDNLGAWDRWDDWDVYAVASDDESGRGVFVREGMDVWERRWAVGTLEVVHHESSVGGAGPGRWFRRAAMSATRGRRTPRTG